jgi:hypothetical protein
LATLQALKIGQLEFKEMWREGGSSFVRIVTKPEFGSWVPRGVAGQLQSSNLEFHDIIEYNPAHIAAPGPYKVFVRTESPFLKDKLDIMLTLTIEDVEPGVSCRQVRCWGGKSSGGAAWLRANIWTPAALLCSAAQPCCEQVDHHRRRPATTTPSHTTCRLRLSACLPPLLQVLEGHIRVKMGFGVGRIVEGIVKDSLHNVSESETAARPGGQP